MFEQKIMQAVINICNMGKSEYKSGKLEVLGLISDKSQPTAQQQKATKSHKLHLEITLLRWFSVLNYKEIWKV
jgi:hypothetical protein